MKLVNDVNVRMFSTQLWRAGILKHPYDIGEGLKF